jgi:hypothetical protein
MYWFLKSILMGFAWRELCRCRWYLQKKLIFRITPGQTSRTTNLRKLYSLNGAENNSVSLKILWFCLRHQPITSTNPEEKSLRFQYQPSTSLNDTLCSICKIFPPYKTKYDDCFRLCGYELENRTQTAMTAAGMTWMQKRNLLFKEDSLTKVVYIQRQESRLQWDVIEFTQFD